MADATSWERVQWICECALQRGSAERGPLIAQLCEGDDELRREVESLVCRQAAAATFLTASASAPSARRTFQSMDGRSAAEGRHFSMKTS